MEISAQSIQTVGGQSGQLATLAAGLKPGDSLAAQVLARNPAGQALVAIAGKQVHLPLPPSLTPGTLLTLTVQQGANGLQFLVEPQVNTALARPAVPAGQQAPIPQTAANPATSTGTPTTQTQSAQPQASAPAATSARPAAPVPLPPTASGQAPLPPLVNTRTGIPVPAPHGTTPGQTLSAQVLSTPTSNTAIISLGNQELPVLLLAPSRPGAVLPLVVQSGPQGLQIAHAPPGGSPLSASSPAPAPASSGPAPSGATPASTTQSSPSQSGAVAVPAASPAPALAQASLASLGNQNTVATLLASVLRLGDRSRELPDEVQRAVARLAGSALQLGAKAPDAQALQRAIARSGVFLEAQLAAGATNDGVDGDLKSLLLVLRRSLSDWLGPEAKPAVLSGKPPPPPQPGAAPRAPSPPPTPVLDDQPITELGKSLLSQTDAALSRMRLHQMASLPDRMDGAPAAKQDIHLEIPITLGQQAGVLGLVITRDEEGETGGEKKDTWRVQFSINANVIGEVGAEIGLLAGRTNVVLSAVEPDTVTALSEGIGDLTEALEAVGLTPGILRVRRQGTTPPPSGFTTAPAPQSSHYLDRDT